ncbi:TAXI family TRAP transporter solute-binding subunit [Denitromonas halophila]|uniref:TAXI family TRAP transporter solute-binding subunit n=1 Tax=Denitromonas halophila TaxID=1629404 RepID=A0A557QJF0_9RHOO|nr:TAXI family TRAP transporter solute-binding subunit [Denitromonas halophila]TVO53031.1 TAXI family TRAP transporter solute-binding subunit [Denitromonas halophila]
MKTHPSRFKPAALILGASLLTVFHGAAVAQSSRLAIGTTSSSSSHYGYFVAVSQIVNSRVKGVDTSVVETGATMDNLRRMDRRQVDLGLVTTNVIHHANAGTGDFAGKPSKSRLLWIYSIAPQNAVVRKDSGVNSFADLAGKKFNTGLKGSATEKTTDAVFALLGITPDVVRGSTGEIVDAVKDNRVVGYVKSGAGLKLDASTREIATFTPISVLGLDDGQKAKIASAMPELSIVDVPADAQTKLPAYSTWGFGVGAAAAPELDENIAYQIVKAVCEDKDIQAAAFGEVAGVDIAQMTLKYASSPLHPGAVRYFRERGLEVPARLIAP